MSPSGDDVRRQLDRLLASPVFANAGRMSRFLKFVVEKTLAGEGQRLKEYVIGVEVFDRDTAYDPRIDAIVRVEAARLRSKLTEYYAGEGRADPIVLSLPKGGYAPLITLDERHEAGNAHVTNGAMSVAHSPPLHDALPAASQARRRASAWAAAAVLGVAILAFVVWAPSLAPLPELRIAVLPFDIDDSADAGLATRLTEGVTAELVRDGRFSVVSSSAARAVSTPTARPREVSAALAADVLIQARLLVDGEHVVVEARAVIGELEEKLWVQSFAGTAADSDALEHAIAGAIVDKLIYLRVEKRQ